MEINSINQMFNQKLQDINSKVTINSNVNNKFKTLLEEANLKTTSSESKASASEKNNDSDISSILKTMIATQSSLNSISALSGDNSSSLFPTSTMNSTINSLQQTQLLKAIENISNENKITDQT